MVNKAITVVTPFIIPRCSMYGLFTYITGKMGTLKGKWLGTYSRPMEHL